MNNAAQWVQEKQEKPISTFNPVLKKGTSGHALEPQLEYPANWQKQPEANNRVGTSEPATGTSPTLLNAGVQKSADIPGTVSYPKNRIYNVRVVSSSASLEQRQTPPPFTAAAQINAKAASAPKPANTFYNVAAPASFNTPVNCGFCEAVHRMVPPSAYNQAANDPTVANLNNVINTLRSVLH